MARWTTLPPLRPPVWPPGPALPPLPPQPHLGLRQVGHHWCDYDKQLGDKRGLSPIRSESDWIVDSPSTGPAGVLRHGAREAVRPGARGARSQPPRGSCQRLAGIPRLYSTAMTNDPEVTPDSPARAPTAAPAPDRTAELAAALAERILVLDGAMGTMVQTYGLTEADCRGERFKTWPCDIKGNNDLLVLTQPGIIGDIHRSYLEAGADIIETNTFNANALSQADYGTQELCYEINLVAARLARSVADEVTNSNPAKPRYVAGALGPTNRTASISPDVNDPGARNVSYEQLVDAYLDQANGLVDGGADLLMIETIFDTLNARAAIFALERLFEQRGRRWPVMISGTITDASGRTLSGQTTEAFWNSVRHARPLAAGLNCALGGREMRPYLAEMSRLADCFVLCYPNAGLPNAFGGYDEEPADTAGILAEFGEAGFVNLVGGCCGTTPEHIAAVASAVADVAPRPFPDPPEPVTRLSGLEPLTI